MYQRLCGILLFFALWLALPALAQLPPTPLSDFELASKAEFIIQGTVLEVKAGPGAEYDTGMAIIHVDKVIKGPAEMKTITAYYPAKSLTIYTKDIIMQLEPGDQSLFFIQHPGDPRPGYCILDGKYGLRPVTDAARFAGIVEQLPLVTLTRPAKPFYFGQVVPVTVTVKNRSQEPLTVRSTMLLGEYSSPRMYVGKNKRVPLADRTTLDATAPAAQPKLPVIIGPGEEYSAILNIECQLPLSFAIFPADSYLQAPITIRGVVTIQNGKESINLLSPWETAMIGFPPPMD